MLDGDGCYRGKLSRAGKRTRAMEFLLFVCLFVAALGLRCCTWTFSRCSEWELLSCCGAPASHWGGFFSFGSQARGCPGFSSCSTWDSCSKARGIFPYQGSNPCLLHQQADSQPVDHQGSAGVAFNCGELMNVNMTGPRPLYFHSKLLLFLLLSFPLPWTTWSLGKWVAHKPIMMLPAHFVPR